MAVKQIKIYFKEMPLINSQGNNFTLGYINENNQLLPIDKSDPDLQVNILEPEDGKVVDNELIIVAANNSVITLRLKITYLDYTEYFSFAMPPALPKITTQDIYNRITSLLPKNVYTMSQKSNNYAENMATAEVIAELYNGNNFDISGIYSINNIIRNIFPESGAYGWEYFLTGNNRLLYQDATQYGKLLQHIYSCEINNNTNPYWLSYDISKYIYLWINKQRFIYISENNFQLLHAFILNLNSLGNSMLLSNSPYNGVVTFYVLTDNPDGTPPITIEEQKQINTFIRQITRAGVNISVDYTKSSSDFNLTYLDNTYHTDPRQYNTYCIAYNQNILSEALGFSATNIDSINLSNITDFSVSPPTGNNLSVGTNYTVSVNTVPIWGGTTSVINYLQCYISDTSILDSTFDGNNLILHAKAPGQVTVNYYLGSLNYANSSGYIYNII